MSINYFLKENKMKIDIYHRADEIEVSSNRLKPLFERFDFGYKFDPIPLDEEGIEELDRLCNVLSINNNIDKYCACGITGWSAEPLGLILLNEVIKAKSSNLEPIFLRFVEEYVKINPCHPSEEENFQTAIAPAICWEVYNNKNKSFWKAFEFKDASHEASCFLGPFGVPI